MNFLYSIDLSILKFVNETLANPFFDFLMPFITDLHLNRWFAIPVLVILFSYYIYRFKKKSFLIFFFLLLAISASDFTGGRIKRLVERPRPFQNTEIQVTQHSPASQNTSFYSNHATNNFTFATYSSLIFPEAKIFYFSIAALISYSRVYNGVHYPSDVFTGSIAGILWGTLFHILLLKTVSFFRKENT
jgi:undecaprenyl-diphosphatase